MRLLCPSCRRVQPPVQGRSSPALKCPACRHVAPVAPAPEAGSIAVKGPHGSFEVEWKGLPLTAGRGKHNAVRLDDAGISHTHVLLRVRDGCLEFEDLGSKNGCRVDGELSPGGTLATGEQLAIGQFALSAAAPRGAAGSFSALHASAPTSLRGLRAGTDLAGSTRLAGGGERIHVLSVVPQAPGGTDPLDRAGQLLLLTVAYRRCVRRLRDLGATLLAATPPALMAYWDGRSRELAFDCAQSLLSLSGDAVSLTLVLWSGRGDAWNFEAPAGLSLALTAPARQAFAALSALGRVPGQLTAGGAESGSEYAWQTGLGLTTRDVAGAGSVVTIARKDPRATGTAAGSIPVRRARLASTASQPETFGLLLPVERRGQQMAACLLLRRPLMGLTAVAQLELDGRTGPVNATLTACSEVALEGQTWSLSEVLLPDDAAWGAPAAAVEATLMGQEECPVCFSSYDVSSAAPGEAVVCGHCGVCVLARAEELPEAAAAVTNARPPPAEAEASAAFPDVPGFTIRRKLGEGGMGAVFEANRSGSGERVALKMMLAQWSENSQARARFEREGELLTSLVHPNIVRTLDMLSTPAGRFLVMEFVEGVALDGLMKARPFALEETVHVVAQVAQALDYCHGRGVLHRDIKPANVLLSRSEEVKVADFGLAGIVDPSGKRLTSTNMAMGTPRYMAPEQALDAKRADRRADVFSLGVLFYEMLTRRLPEGTQFPLPSEVDSNVPAAFDPIVLRALEVDRDERWPDVASFISQLGKASRELRLLPRFPALPGR